MNIAIIIVENHDIKNKNKNTFSVHTVDYLIIIVTN